MRGRNAGFDVEIARWFAPFAFGRSDRVTFTCVTTPAREPALTTGRVDMVIATFTYTADREHADRLLAGVLQGDRSAARAEQLAEQLARPSSRGKTVATTSGSIYDRWMKNCFKDTKLVVTDRFTNALLAFRDGRADTLMWDDTVLVGIAAADRT